MRRLVSEAFGDSSKIAVESHGNVFAATAFLQGVVQTEVKRELLDIFDEAYPVIVTARAQREE